MLNQPLSDFWRTDPVYFWLLMNAESEAKPGLTNEDKDELLQLLYEARENG